MLAHEAAHVRHRHLSYLLPVAALEPAAVVAPPLRSSLAATRYAMERWADEKAIDLGGDRSSLVSALGRISTTPSTSPITFFGAEDVKGRVQALEDPQRVRGDHTAVVVGGLIACSLVSIAALMIWL